jgi:hypothetical protein
MLVKSEGSKFVMIQASGPYFTILEKKLGIAALRSCPAQLWWGKGAAALPSLLAACRE